MRLSIYTLFLKMTEKDDILIYLRNSINRFKEEYGVRRIGVFGSLIREEQADSSDIDIIIEMDSPTFDKYMDLKFELEDHFQRPVDLVLAETVKQRLRSRIESEVVYA